MSDINRIRKLAGLPELKQEQLTEGMRPSHARDARAAELASKGGNGIKYVKPSGYDPEGDKAGRDRIAKHNAKVRAMKKESITEDFDWLNADPEFITWALENGFSDEDYQELKDVIASDYDEAGQPQSFAQHNPEMMGQILQTYFSHLYPDMKRRYDAAFGESVNEAPEDYPNVVSTKPGDGDYEKGFMYWDTETGELYKTHPGYEVKGSYDDFVAGRGEVKSGGDFAHMSDEELQDAINDAMEQGDQGAAEEYYAELEKRSMGESADEQKYHDEEEFEQGYKMGRREKKDYDDDDYTLGGRSKKSNESVEEADEELTEAPTMDTTQLITLMKNAGMNEEAISKKLDEWANTPEGVGEIEPTSHGDTYDYAQAVNLSLKKYLDAEDMKVGIKEHTAVDMKALWEEAKANRIDEVGVNDIDDEECDNCGSSLHNGECPQCDADDVNESAKVDEEDVEEGNAYSKALADAKAKGDDEFEVDGKTHKVKESEEIEESDEEEQIDEQAEMIARIRKLSGL